MQVECDCEMASSLEDQQAVQMMSSVLNVKVEDDELDETPRVLARGEPAIPMPTCNGCINDQIIEVSPIDVEDELDRKIKSHLSHFEARFEQFVSDVNTKLSNLDSKLDQLLHQKRKRIVREEEGRVSGSDDKDEEDDTEMLSKETIEEVRRWATSPRNFALGLVRKLFTKEEMRNSNVNGKQGRLQLDKSRIAYVKDTVICYYNIPISEQTLTWKHCIVSIDEGCRRLRRCSIKKEETYESNPQHENSAIENSLSENTNKTSVTTTSAIATSTVTTSAITNSAIVT